MHEGALTSDLGSTPFWWVAAPPGRGSASEAEGVRVR